MENSGQTLEAAVALAKSGNRTEARDITMQILKANPSDTSALWLLANVTSSVEERRKALTRLLQLKPNAEKAKAMLEAMDEPKPKESAPATVTPPTTDTSPTAGLKFIEAKDKYILPLTKTKTWFLRARWSAPYD